jgi:hypothetical protein
MRFITSLLLGLVLLLNSTTLVNAAPWNSDKTDDICYQLLIEQTNKIKGLEKYQPISFQDFYQKSLLETTKGTAFGEKELKDANYVRKTMYKNSRDMIFGLNFTGSQFAALNYKMGEVFGADGKLLLREAFPYFASARTLPDNELYDNYRVMLSYTAETLDFLYCSAIVQPIAKPNLVPKDITAGRIGMMLPPQPFEIQKVTKDGKNFKILDIRNDILDKADDGTLIEMHWISVIPESTSKTYNPYALVETYQKLVSDFNRSGNFDPKNRYAIRNFDPLKNYAIGQEMLRQGQEYAWRLAWLVGDDEQMRGSLEKSAKPALMNKVPLATETEYFASIADRLGEKDTTIFTPLDRIRKSHGITDQLTDAYVTDAKKYLANPNDFDLDSLDSTKSKVGGGIGILGLAVGALVIIVLIGGLFKKKKK